MKIVFDVDGTLIHYEKDGEITPRYEVIDLLRWFQRNGSEVFVHSGSGLDYAKRWCQKLGLDVIVVPKGDEREYDIAVDDEQIEIDQPAGRYIRAKVFIKV